MTLIEFRKLKQRDFGNGAVLDAIEAALEILDGINALRDNELSSVTICNDNPDFDGPNNIIYVDDDAIGWVDKAFTGDTLADALFEARRAKIAATPPKPT